MPEVLSLDDRARAAAAALRERAQHPVVPPQRRSTAQRTVIRVVFAVSCVVLVIAGLVALQQRHRSTSADDTRNVRYLIDRLPEGWTVNHVTDVDPNRYTVVGSYALYGTAGDPTAPVASVRWMSSKEFSQDVAYSWLMMTRAMEEIRTGDRTASCGRRLLVSETAEGPEPAWRCIIPMDGGWVGVDAAGVDREQVVAMIAGFTVADGVVALPEALRPPGAVQLGPIGNAPAAGRYVAISTAVSYVSGANHVTLSVGLVSDGDIAASGLGVAWQRESVGDLTVYRIVEGHAVMWQVDGLRFQLSGDAGDLDLAELVPLVRPATHDEWAALTSLPETESSEPVVETTAAPVDDRVPRGSLPVSPPEVVRDVEVEEHYADVTPDAVEFTALPQAIGTVSVGVVGGAVYFATDFMGDKVTLDDGSLDTARLRTMQVGDLVAVYAVTTNPEIALMRVTSPDGTRFLVDFVPISEHTDVRVALVFLLPSTALSVDVTDGAGAVVATLGQPM
jgi:hypothetical protein